MGLHAGKPGQQQEVTADLLPWRMHELPLHSLDCSLHGPRCRAQAQARVVCQVCSGRQDCCQVLLRDVPEEGLHSDAAFMLVRSISMCVILLAVFGLQGQAAKQQRPVDEPNSLFKMCARTAAESLL